MTALARFLDAQNQPAGVSTIYEAALAELRAGRKTSHWMWFVFPQLAGVAEWHGARPSATARRFAITDMEEAARYAGHADLGPRLTEAFNAAAGSGEMNPARLMGGVDAAKLQSSATLFAGFAATGPAARLVLGRLYGGETCRATVSLQNR